MNKEREKLVGTKVMDTDKIVCTILEVTTNSINVLIPSKTAKGIPASNWFTDTDFHKRFKPIDNEQRN